MRHLSAAIVVSLVWATICSAQSTTPRSDEAAKAVDEIARIVGYSMTRGGASEFLQTLTDTIGGRITGSPESKATAELILKALKEAGLENAHLEEYELSSVWRPGPRLSPPEVLELLRKTGLEPLYRLEYPDVKP